MARVIRAMQRSSSLSSSYSYCKTLMNGLQSYHHTTFQSQSTMSTFLSQSRNYISEIPKSPFESNIHRIVRTEIEYQSEYAPPHQPVTEFHSFMVKDRPGEQVITLTRKFGENEDIKIEATMFDGCVLTSKPGDDSIEEDMRLHISLLVDISKGEGRKTLEFVCSAWPDCLEIQKVYMLRSNGIRPYLGPDFKALDRKVQSGIRDFLKARGVDDELSVFLHEFMLNKDRTELIRWLGKVKSFLERPTR